MNDFDITETTPGFSLATAEMYLAGDVDGIRSVSATVPTEVFVGSSLQLALQIIDWYSLNEIADKVAVAYEADNQDELAALYDRGIRYNVSDEGVLNTWLESEEPTQFDFPLEFWTAFKFDTQSRTEEAATKLGLDHEVVKELSAGYVNDGIVPLLTGENTIEVPHAGRFIDDESQARYAVLAIVAYVTATLLKRAAEDRTRVLRDSFPNYPEVTPTSIAETLRSELTKG